ncbi:MAG: DUF481 domain-containing protein [Bacteroidetes bacterium]|nr:DUF481 domain-containing protein [Bacteroidota bacterium]MBS1631442.1 DUF481 domain-containing protein [Bacteroidota bacterium]
MKRILFLNLLQVVLVLTGLPGTAQIINVENARMQSDSIGWMGGASASFSFNKSEQNVFSLNMSAHLQYKTKKDLWLILGNYGYLRGGSKRYLSNRFLHFRYNRKLTPWLRWEAFSQVQKDLVTDIKLRSLTGTGPRFKIVSTKKLHLYAAALLMYEIESEATSPVIKHFNWRSSNYISFTILPNENMEIISTTYFQPRLNLLKDFRLLNDLNLRIKTGKRFSVSLQWNLIYDQFPAGTAPNTIYTFQSGFNYQF